MTLEEAIDTAIRKSTEKGVSLGPLRMSEPATEVGAWVLEFDATDDPAGWAWYFLLTPTGERDIMVVAPA